MSSLDPTAALASRTLLVPGPERLAEASPLIVRGRTFEGVKDLLEHLVQPVGWARRLPVGSLGA